MTAATTDGWKREPDDQSERLISLTMALVYSEYGLTKEEIYSAIRGYRLDFERIGRNGDLSSLNKKFERDKLALRNLGVRIDPGQNSEEGDDDYRYRIAKDTFKWPADVTLTSKQLQLLELAASVWDHAALSPEAANALTRLRAISDITSEDLVAGISPKILTVEPSFTPIRTAIETRNQIAFDYRKADGSLSRRNVEPWQLFQIAGTWMLLGLDVERREPRNFLLRRIQSRISKSEATFTSINSVEIAAAKEKLTQHYSENVAEIEVSPGTSAAAHFGVNAASNQIVKINYFDAGLLAEELIEFGTAVRALKPESLKVEIRKALTRVVENHA